MAFSPSFFKHSSEDRLRGACDGFIIVSRRSLLFLFYIYNPVIRKKAVLPKPQVGESFYNNIIGFYRHHPTGEYRVLWVSQLDPYSQSQNLSEFSLYVHTVGANEPRHVRFRMPIVSSPSAEQKLLKPYTIVAAFTGVLMVRTASPTLREETLLCLTQKPSHFGGCTVPRSRALLRSCSTRRGRLLSVDARPLL